MSQKTCRPLVLLHGWGATPAIWQPLVSVLKALNPEREILTPSMPGYQSDDKPCHWAGEKAQLQEVIAQLQLPTDAHWLGWSLGGNLLLEIVHYLTEHKQPLPQSLILLCSNPSFQQREGSEGMAEETLNQFRSGFDTQPEKTLKRFQLLQMQGESDLRAVKKQLTSLSPKALPAAVEILANGLTALSVLDQRTYCDLSEVGRSTLWLLGENDPLVPAAIADQLHNSLLLPDCGHLPMLSQSQQLAEALNTRLNLLEAEIPESSAV